MAIIVEFAGIPGSGKTTLAAELESALDQSGLPIARPIRSPSGRVLRKLESAFHGRGAVLSAGRALVDDSRPIAHRFRALRWLVATLEFANLATELDTPDSVIVLGEGISQRALLIFLDGSSLRVSSHVHAYVAAVPKPDVILHLKIDPAIALKRQQARRAADLGRGVKRAADRFDLEEEQLRRSMQTAEVFLGQIITALAEQSDAEVIRLDTSDMDVAAADVRSWVVDRVISHIR